MMMEARSIKSIHEEAQDIGVFLPVVESTDALEQTEVLHGYALPNRRALLMQPGNDADENGAPSAETIARYQEAVRAQQYGIVWLETAAVQPNARYFSHGLVMVPENEAKFAELLAAIHDASMEAHGTAPLVIALLDHAGHHALYPVAMEHSTSLPTSARILSDDELHTLVITCSTAAKTAEKAGFSGIAINAADRSLFGESLAAFHRTGKFGGDFDNRTRFLRDCYTAIKMTTGHQIFTIRLSLSDGIPQPDGWGMAFNDESAPDLYEPALLLKVLQALYGLELVSCDIGIPDVNWMGAAKAEAEIIRCSRLCTCIAMLDSDLQQHVQLIVPEKFLQEIPFANLAAGMIQGEFASYGGFFG